MENTTLSGLARTLADAGARADAIGDRDPLIVGTACDSRQVRPGDLFVCKGAAFRPQFLASALEAGAVAYLCAPELRERLEQVAPGVPHLVAADLRRAMAVASAAATGHPDRELPIVGITGTKGKTTTAYLLRSIVDVARGVGACGMVGTVETYDGVTDEPSRNTTPEAPDLWRHLAAARDSHLSALVCEVSSQALKYDRTLGVGLRLACFLNIGLDHISSVEHADFEDYFSSKLKIFSQARSAVVNLDSDHADRVMAAAAACGDVTTFSLRDHAADVWADALDGDEEGVSFDLHAAGQVRRMHLPFPGDFNVSNALCATACALALGCGLDDVERGLARAVVPGRMEFHRSADRRLVALVDFAHNRMAFESLLSMVARTYPDVHKVAVFGATGGKAVERRHELPEVAARYVDEVVLTSDDPWNEDPADICRQMAESLPDGFPHHVELDRPRAVDLAFDMAEGRDGRTLVLLLARGFEDTMHVGDAFVPCESDSAMARAHVEAYDRAHPVAR